MSHERGNKDADGFNEDRIANRKAAMSLAQRAAIAGDPIAGAFFGFQSFVRPDPFAAFIESVQDYDYGYYEDDEDDADIRPY